MVCILPCLPFPVCVTVPVHEQTLPSGEASALFNFHIQKGRKAPEGLYPPLFSGEAEPPPFLLTYWLQCYCRGDLSCLGQEGWSRRVRRFTILAQWA